MTGEKHQAGYGITMIPRAMTIADKLRVIIASHAGTNPECINDSDRLGSDYGFMPEDHASLLQDIATEFGLIISDEDYHHGIETVSQLREVIERGRASQ